MSVVAGLTLAFESAAKDKHTLCLILDGAQIEGSHQKLDRWNISYLSLFDGTPEESLIEIAPLLISTAGLSADQKLKLFTWAEGLAYQFPLLSWVESALPAIELAQHLRNFHVVGLSEDQTMLLRWYDTRILPVWLACLTAGQSEAFAAGVVNWSYVDRTGQTSSLVSTPIPAALPLAPALSEPMIVLSDAQYAVLVDAADLDVLIGHLRRVIPDETKQVPKGLLTSFVSKYQQQAVQAGLHDIDRQTQYVLLALYTSGKAMDQAELKAFMKKPPQSLDDFNKGLQALSDAVWQAGPALWDALPKTSNNLIELDKTSHG